MLFQNYKVKYLEKFFDLFFSYRRRNQPDWYCSSIFFVRRYKMSEIQPRKGIILHTKSLKKKRKMQFSILTQYGTAWWKMIPQEIFGKYLQTVSSYSVLNFPSALIFIIILIITSFFRKNCTSAMAVENFKSFRWNALTIFTLKGWNFPYKSLLLLKFNWF